MTGLTYLLGLMFSVQDYTTLASTSTGLPLAEIFQQATGGVSGAFALTFILWVAIGPCMIGSQLSQFPLITNNSIAVLTNVKVPAESSGPSPATAVSLYQERENPHLALVHTTSPANGADTRTVGQKFTRNSGFPSTRNSPWPR